MKILTRAMLAGTLLLSLAPVAQAQQRSHAPDAPAQAADYYALATHGYTLAGAAALPPSSNGSNGSNTDCGLTIVSVCY